MGAETPGLERGDQLEGQAAQNLEGVPGSGRENGDRCLNMGPKKGESYVDSWAVGQMLELRSQSAFQGRGNRDLQPEEEGAGAWTPGSREGRG